MHLRQIFFFQLTWKMWFHCSSPLLLLQMKWVADHVFKSLWAEWKRAHVCALVCVLQPPECPANLDHLPAGFSLTPSRTGLGAGALTHNAPGYLEVDCLGINMKAILVAAGGSVVGQGRTQMLTHAGQRKCVQQLTYTCLFWIQSVKCHNNPVAKSGYLEKKNIKCMTPHEVLWNSKARRTFSDDQNVLILSWPIHAQ